MPSTIFQRLDHWYRLALQRDVELSAAEARIFKLEVDVANFKMKITELQREIEHLLQDSPTQ